MREAEITITTDDGTLDAFTCHPEEGGPFPAVILYMDAPGIREELRDMVRRLATAGYFVMLPNLYYRTGREGNYGFGLPPLSGPRSKLEFGAVELAPNVGPA